MIKLGFKDKYKVLHMTNEFGLDIIGGLCTYINEQYKYRDEDTGFIHYIGHKDFKAENYVGMTDTLVVTHDDVSALESLDFDILVVHFFGLTECITQKLIENKKLVYVVHSVPTPEPIPRYDPFGGNPDIESKFRILCDCSNLIVCVSDAEKQKLLSICPQYEDKVVYIHNGITVPDSIEIPSLNGKKKLGYIARTDYRKGLIETLKVIRDLDVELHVACDVGDKTYLRQVIQYIEATGIADKIHFYGFCVGERKKAFFEYVDAVIVPSLYEPFGYTTIEPILHGKPIIVSNNGGIGEIVGEEYRYQFYPYRLHEFKNAVSAFLNDDETVIENEICRLVERLPLFDSETMVERYRQAYMTL